MVLNFMSTIVKQTGNHYTENQTCVFLCTDHFNAKRCLTRNCLCVFVCACPSKHSCAVVCMLWTLVIKKETKPLKSILFLLSSHPQSALENSLCALKCPTTFFFFFLFPRQLPRPREAMKSPWMLFPSFSSLILSFHPFFSSLLLSGCPQWLLKRPAQLKHGHHSRWILTSPGKKDLYFGGREGLKQRSENLG